jgi:nicotine blue oxidoreductase
VRRVVAAWRAGAGVACATYGGRRGHPVLLGAAHWDGVAAAAVGELGARAFLAAHPDLVTEVPCDGTGRPDDVDTPEALR